MFTLRRPRIDRPASAASTFEALVRRHEDAIYRFAYRLTGNHEDAEDLVQEGLIEAYEAFPRFQAGTYFDRWLFRILRHTFIDGARARPKVVIHSLDEPVDPDIGATGGRDIVDWSNHPELRMLGATLDEPIQEALMRLPDDFRTVVALADIEGLSYEDVSKIVDCPVGTVRSRLHRARLLLKDSLRDYLK